jgi:hypothetical protein
MQHLTDEQLVEAAEGDLRPSLADHLTECRGCAERVAETRGVLDAVSSVPVVEPSPLFWEHFAARVNAAIDAPEPSAPWLSARSVVWIGAAGIVLMMVGIHATRTWFGAPSVEPAASLTAPAAGPGETDNAGAATRAVDEPLDDDTAWAVVQRLAGDLDYDDAREAGILPQPASVDHAATELSREERAELMRLIRLELKRTGA